MSLVVLMDKNCVFCEVYTPVPIPVAVRSKARVCNISLAEIMDSNSVGVMDVCCDCRVLSGRSLCDGLISRPEELYRL